VNQAKPKQGVASVDSAVEVLKAFATDPSRGFSARDMADLLETSKSSLQRTLVSLERGGLLSLNESTSKYQLAHGVLQLASAYLKSAGVDGIIRKHIEALRNDCRETVMLSIEVDGLRVTIAQSESPKELRYRTDVGFPYPLWGGATGWVLASLAGTECQEAVLAEYERHLIDDHHFSASQRRTKVDNLDAELKVAAAQGWATSRGTWIPGGAGIAHALNCRVNGTYGAVSIYGPEARMPRGEVPKLLAKLKEVAWSLDDALGVF
jgi:DNA-binding IclR family transcriptional regulator